MIDVQILVIFTLILIGGVMTFWNYEHVPSTATIGVGMIDPDNYYQTVKAHTKTQLDKLQESDEYIASKATKGEQIENWNWQAKQSLNRKQTSVID
jgi:hypothetical protein